MKKFFAELFRVEDWQKTPRRVSVPLIVFILIGVGSAAVMYLLGWPSDAWRVLVAVLAGSIAAAGVVRWLPRVPAGR